MLSAWLELPGVPEHLAELSEAAGVDLLAHGTVSDADTIRDTAVAQPLIVATGLLSFGALMDGQPGGSPGLVAGHSVGEFTAAAVAGLLSEHQAIGLVRVRSTGMAQASAATPTGMSAVLGGDPEEVLQGLAALGLTPANVNGAGQVVAAGTLDQLAALAADPPAKTRVMPLQVAGAFHTEHMHPAIGPLADAAATVTASTPGTPLLSNYDGKPVTDAAAGLNSLVLQVGRPVRWDLCMQQMIDTGVDALIELAPAGTLVNLAKRAMRGVPSVAVKSPADLEAARALLAEHG